MTEEKTGADAEEKHTTLFGELVDKFVSAIAHKDAHRQEEDEAQAAAPADAQEEDAPAPQAASDAAEGDDSDEVEELPGDIHPLGDEAVPDAAPEDDGRRLINLALQGGGSHGAFTWGVLDALLEDGRLEFEGISGTSAGAMNAVVMAHAFAKAGEEGLEGAQAREAARTALRRFWESVGMMGSIATGVPVPGMQNLVHMATQWLAPTQINPLGVNPLLRLVKREVDFELLARQSKMKVFVNATNVRTGRGEVFSGRHLTADAVMASACLPMLYQAVQINGEYYWDGGYSGNPVIYPLIYHTKSVDVLLVQINPIEIPQAPGMTAAEINERINDITFNTPLLAEFRAMDFITRLIDEGRLDTKRYKRMCVHRIDGGEVLMQYNVTSKARADSQFVHTLFENGRKAGEQWLANHFDDIGKRSTIDLLGGRRHSTHI